MIKVSFQVFVVTSYIWILKTGIQIKVLTCYNFEYLNQAISYILAEMVVL